MAGGDHHFSQGIDGQQLLPVDLQKAVDVGDQLDLALLDGGGMHVLVGAHVVEHLRRVVLVEHVLVVFPDVDVVLAHAQQHRHVLRRDHMALAEYRVLGDSGNNLRNIVTENLTDGFLGFHQLHGCASPLMLCV